MLVVAEMKKLDSWGRDEEEVGCTKCGSANRQERGWLARRRWARKGFGHSDDYKNFLVRNKSDVKNRLAAQTPKHADSDVWIQIFHPCFLGFCTAQLLLITNGGVVLLAGEALAGCCCVWQFWSSNQGSFLLAAAYFWALAQWAGIQLLLFSPKQQSGLCSTNLGVAAQGLTYQSVFCPWAFLNLNLQYGTITAFEKKKTFSTVKMYVLIALPFINRNDGGSFVNQWIYSNSFIAWHAI